MTGKLLVDLARYWESLGCLSILCVHVISGMSVFLGCAVGAGSCWRREGTAIQKHTNTHTHHLKAETVLPCLYLAPYLGIPGNAHRVYWHSCLIACSIVHSVRANPPHPSFSLSLCTSFSVSLTHSTEHQTYYPHSHSALEHSKTSHTSKQAQRHMRTHTYTNSGRCTHTIFARYVDLVTLFMWPVYWYVIPLNHESVSPYIKLKAGLCVNTVGYRLNMGQNYCKCYRHSCTMRSVLWAKC